MKKQIPSIQLTYDDGFQDRANERLNGYNNWGVVIKIVHLDSTQEEVQVWMWLPHMTFTASEDVNITDVLHLTANPRPSPTMRYKGTF